jgi:uncharacterized protein (DUF58 family)
VGVWIAIGIGLLVLGAASGAVGLLLVGFLLLLTTWLTGLWSRYGLRRLTYQRRLERDRAVVGDRVGLDVAVRNEKALPLPFVRTEDLVPDDLVLEERPVARSDRPGRAMIDENWSVGWFQQVVRHRHVVAARRGLVRFGPVRLHVADLFGRAASDREDQLPAELLIRPLTAAIRPAGGHRPAPGDRPSRRGLIEDPALLAGVRPFQPGDPLRRVHWRATARLGQPVSRRFDPSQTRHALVALDVQTLDEPHWVMAYDEDLVEGLVVAAGSLMRALLGEGVACGVAAAAWTGTPHRFAYLAPAAGPGQLPQATDLLARLSPFASAPFEALLGSLPARLPPGATVYVLTARDPAPYLRVLRRIQAGGADVRLTCMGAAAALAVQRARTAGLSAGIARVVPDWRAATVVELVG